MLLYSAKVGLCKSFNTHPGLTTRPPVSPHAVLGQRFEICTCALVQVFELPMTEEHHNGFYSAEVHYLQRLPFPLAIGEKGIVTSCYFGSS